MSFVTASDCISLQNKKRELDVEIADLQKRLTPYYDIAVAHLKKEKVPKNREVILKGFYVDANDVFDYYWLTKETINGVAFVVEYNVACQCHPEDEIVPIYITWDDMQLTLAEYDAKIAKQYEDERSAKEKAKQQEAEQRKQESDARERKLYAELKNKFENG